MIGKIIELLAKITPRLAGAIFVFSTSLLVMPKWLASILSVDTFRNNRRDAIGLAFLLSFAFLVVEFIIYLERKLKQRRLKYAQYSIFRNLTKEEKEMLSRYVILEEATLAMPMADGVKGGLEAKGIIYRSSPIGFCAPEVMFSYNIQPWALEYLRKHKDLLD